MLSQIQSIRRRCGADPKADAVSGNELATFLLGYPTMGGVDRNIDPAFSNFYWAVFLQDDWKVAPRLTVNWGLRWDYEAPGFERYDRMVRGFDFDAPSPIAGAASGLNLRGAVTFARLNGAPRGVFEPDRNNFQPRIGAAYQLGQKWVIRAGYGLYYLGQNEPGSVQGFSQRTPIISTTDNLTPLITLSDPFANYSNGRLLDPIGASHRPLPYSHQYSFDIERELPGGLLAEAAYVGNATRKLPLNFQTNFLPATELGRRMASGAIDTAYYTGRVPNPLEGLIPDNAALNGATIPRQQLLLPYPHYGESC